MISMRLLTILLLLSALALGSTGASADDWSDTPFQVAQSNGCKSLSDAVEQVRKQTDGRILSAETRTQGGREVHHIKVLTRDGKVKTHRIQGCRRAG